MERKLKLNFVSLGTEIEIQLVASQQQHMLHCGTLFVEIEKIYTRAMQVFNRFSEDSELTLLNASLGEKRKCSDWMKVVALKCLEYYENTGGIFDPRIIDALEKAGYDKDFSQLSYQAQISPNSLTTPSLNPLTTPNFPALPTPLIHDLIVGEHEIQFNHRMDFSGIVKGFVTDQVAAYLENVGVENFLIESGGDIYARGHDVNQQFWYAEVEGIPEEKMLLKLKDESIATSGINRRKWEVAGKRKHHIINPKNPEQFSFDLKTVTVLASSTESADVWAKVLFLVDQEKAQQYATKFKLKYIFQNYNGKVVISESLKENV